MKSMFVGLLLSLLPLASLAQAHAEFEMIEPAGDQYYNYNFGSTFVNSRKYVDFTVTSVGDEPLELKKLAIAGGFVFDAQTNCPDSLPVGQKCTVRTFFWPREKKLYSGRLYMVFAHGRSIVNLAGRGI
ncbi:hypothetical protein DOM22_03715 [Bdellovibrio sp. ZAP7]|uniref:hypothetical protein n=1 Tax=Bdellovibrio sp. ZAP7 TaxID=2231053 RepID=UPI001156E54B|nr:hypothetical protein [Bdellovibrio sp. ZAP7]QDK44325.1 hypothetical protein DOM22_03715 [Bdellovibrio sp. ZAP7]